MSIKYSLAELAYPLTIEVPKKVRAHSQVREEVGLYQIARKIAYTTSHIAGDLLNLLHSLICVASTHFKNSDSLSPDYFSKFQCHISSEGMDTNEEFDVSNIRRIRNQFRTGKLFRLTPERLKFECVYSGQSP